MPLSLSMARHQHYLTDEFANLSIIRLPPYSPELNPIEQVWQWLRQNELANQCFEGYEDIVEQCCRAWNSFISDSKRFASLCSRDWIEVEINYGDWYYILINYYYGKLRR
jgi:transposase